jgi:DNA-binding transcriptional LysR family regulator
VELRHLRYFVAVAETEHFGRAARALCVSQPALSQQIADLERELGVQLFTRLPRGVRLSEPGRAFLDHARAALATVAAGAEHAREVARGAAGALTVGLPETATALGVVLPRLDRFRATWPRVELTVSGLGWLAQPRAVLAGALDAGFAWSADAADPAGGPRRVGDDTSALHLAGLAGVRLLDDPGAFALLPADHALANQAALAPADLGALTLGLFERALHPPLYDAIVRALGAAGVQPPVIALGIAAAGSTPPLLAATRGWTFCTAAVAADPLPGVAARSLAGVRMPAGLDVVWRAGDDRPAVRALVAALVPSADREPGSAAGAVGASAAEPPHLAPPS